MPERLSPTASRRITPVDSSTPDQIEPSADDVGRLVVVYGPRADVGVTTVAEALSLAFRSVVGNDVALAELDPRGDRAHSHDGMSVAIDIPGADSAMVRRTDGVWTFAMTRPLAPAVGDAKAVTVALDAMRARFPVSVAELEHQVNERTLAAFDAADRIVMLTEGTVPSVRGTQRVLRLCQRLNYPDEKMCLVLNRFDAPGALSAADVAAALRRELYWMVAASSPVDVAGLAAKLLDG
jgi:Flp pilus assembly CpaE family ATPase